MYTKSWYHMLLRMSGLTIALILVFVSGVIVPQTRLLTEDTTIYLANVIGMNASVLPNEINTLNAQLEQKQKQIEAREIAVSFKEQDLQESDMSVFVLSCILFVLLCLIVLNYILDYHRIHQRTERITA